MNRAIGRKGLCGRASRCCLAHKTLQVPGTTGSAVDTEMWRVPGEPQRCGVSPASPSRGPSAHPQALQSLSRVRLFCVPRHCSLPCFPVRGILQARVLEWVVLSFSRGSSQPRDQTHVSCIGRRVLYHSSPQGGPFSYLPYCQSLITSTLTSLIHLELSCFLCQIGVEFLPQNFFFYIILYLKLAKKNIKNFNIALTQVSIGLLYLSVSGLSLCTHRHTQRHTHTHTHTHILSF